MKTRWKITCQYFGNEKLYAIYRLIDPTAVDHSGNRKYAIGYIFNDESQAQKVADELNRNGVQ